MYKLPINNKMCGFFFVERYLFKLLSLYLNIKGLHYAQNDMMSANRQGLSPVLVLLQSSLTPKPGFTKLHMGLVVLMKKMSVNLLLQNTNLVSVLRKFYPNFAGHV